MTNSPRRDVFWLAAALLAGVVMLPPLVYATGVKTLGVYFGGGLGAFLADFYSSLVRFEPAALLIATGPLLVVLVWRAALRVAAAFEPDGDADVSRS